LVGGSQARSVKLAEYITFAVGLLATAVALYLSRLHVTSLYDRFVELMYVLGGGFAGIYGLGLFSRRANWQGAIAGIVASIVVTVYAKYATDLHVLMYAPLSIGTCMIVGWLVSFAFPPPSGSLRGLTLIPAPALA
jgi:Na+/proline symporter